MRNGTGASDEPGAAGVSDEQRPTSDDLKSCEVCEGPERELRELGLDPALVLDEVAAGVAGVDVVPAALLLLRREAAVDERTDTRSEVRHHDTAPGERGWGAVGPL